MDNRKIVCTNEDGVSMTFGTLEFTPYVLLQCDGIYTISNDVITTANTMIDGSTYQGSITKMRNIVLTIAEKDNHLKNRNLIYELFKPKSPGTFTYYEDDESKTIQYYVESIDFTQMYRARIATVSLLCPDPFFRDLEDMVITMAGWSKLWTFPHQFLEQKEPFGERLKEMLKEINNESSADNIGLKIVMKAEGSVVNPAMYHVEENQFIKVGTTLKPLVLNSGDQIIITTETNNKKVLLVHDDVETEINEYLDDDSDYIQLQSGINSLRYAADSGEEYLSVEVSFRYRYLGV